MNKINKKKLFCIKIRTFASDTLTFFKINQDLDCELNKKTQQNLNRIIILKNLRILN